MRLLLVIAMGTALVGSALYRVRDAGQGRAHEPNPETARPAARGYYALRSADDAAIYRLAPGSRTLQVRVRGLTAPPNPPGDLPKRHARLLLKLLSHTGEGLAEPLEIVVPLIPQRGHDGPAAARPAEPLPRRLSKSTTRRLTVSAPRAGGYLSVTATAPDTHILVRVLRRQGPKLGETGEVRWRRLGAKPTFGPVPDVVRVIEQPRAAHRRRERHEDTRPTAAEPEKLPDAELKATEAYALRPDNEAAVELELVESVGGAVRVQARTLVPTSVPNPETEASRQAETDRSRPVLHYAIFARHTRLDSGVLRLPQRTEPHASLTRHAVTLAPSRFHPPAAGAAAETPLGPTEAISRPLSRYLFYPPGADRLRLWAETESGAEAYVSFASWSGPTRHLPLRQAPDDATEADWHPVRARNHEALDAAGRIATLRTARVLREDAPEGPIAGYEQLSPTHGARRILLEPRRGPWRETDLARLRHRGDSVCAVGSEESRTPHARPGQVWLRVRLADASRLGQPLQVRLHSPDSDPVLAQALVATAADLLLRNVPPGCHPIFISGLGPTDQVFTNARSAPLSAIFARSTVWEPLDTRALSFEVSVDRPLRVTLTAHPVRHARLRLRVLVDGGAPRRLAAPMATGFTPPVVEREIHGQDPGAARMADEATVRLATPTRVTLPLQADLAPGLHRIDVQTAGTGRVLLRLSARDAAMTATSNRPTKGSTPGPRQEARP